jgi:hypothetical protein
MISRTAVEPATAGTAAEPLPQPSLSPSASDAQVEAGTTIGKRRPSGPAFSIGAAATESRAADGAQAAAAYLAWPAALRSTGSVKTPPRDLGGVAAFSPMVRRGGPVGARSLGFRVVVTRRPAAQCECARVWPRSPTQIGQRRREDTRTKSERRLTCEPPSALLRSTLQGLRSSNGRFDRTESRGSRSERSAPTVCCAAGSAP